MVVFEPPRARRLEDSLLLLLLLLLLLFRYAAQHTETKRAERLSLSFFVKHKQQNKKGKKDARKKNFHACMREKKRREKGATKTRGPQK
jgi:hypothetical protein